MSEPVVFFRPYCLACQVGGTPWQVHEDYHRLLELEQAAVLTKEQQADLEDLRDDLEEAKEDLRAKQAALEEYAGDLRDLLKPLLTIYKGGSTLSNDELSELVLSLQNLAGDMERSAS